MPSNELSRKESKKSEASSKHRAPFAADSPAKSPEAKKDGELPFQDRSTGLPQAAKESSEHLQKTFTDALKDINVFNGSKGKPKLERSSLNTVLQEDEHDGK